MGMTFTRDILRSQTITLHVIVLRHALILCDIWSSSSKLIDPANVAKVWVSPRQRAVRTYELLAGNKEDYETTESLAEWDYGYHTLRAMNGRS